MKTIIENVAKKHTTRYNNIIIKRKRGLQMGQLRINLCFDPRSDTDMEVYNFLMATDRKKSSVVIEAIQRVFLSTSYWDGKQNERDKQMANELQKIVKNNAPVDTEAITRKLDQIIDLINNNAVTVQPTPQAATQPQMNVQSDTSLRPLEPIGSAPTNQTVAPPAPLGTLPPLQPQEPQQQEQLPATGMDMGLFAAMKAFTV